MRNKIVDFLKSDAFFVICLLLFFIICNIKLDYFINIGGGISNVESRVNVVDKYKSDGSFNISYVSQMDANVLTYLISYLVPSWEREKASNYKYNSNESMKDISFRSDLDLDVANSTATYWAYTLANKEVKATSKKAYITVNLLNIKGLKVGDELITIDGHEFSDIKQCQDYVQTKKVGDEVTLKIIRNNKEKEFKVKVQEEDGKNMIGIGIQYYVEYKTDPEVTFNFKKSESGPSGGLITTLELYNQLTKKDLTGGKTIAGTGTIEVDGTIGEIGGIEHKILGASKAHADIFLTPGGDNYKDAKKYIKEKNLKIKLIKVETIQEAIDILEELK